MDSRFSDSFLRAVGAAHATERQRQRRPRQHPVDLRAPVDTPSGFDVLGGRGQGVQRHPGNVKYRRLVFLNKGLYAGCPSADRAKISRGIVAAVRKFGGRFLELDERTGTYRDIGDKKAWDKTSQALREGQKTIRQKLHDNTASDDFDTSLLSFCRSMAGTVPTAEGYFGYSVQVLESLCKSHEGVPSQAPPSRRRQNPSLARAPRAAPSLGAPVVDDAATVEGTGVDPSAIRSLSSIMDSRFSDIFLQAVGARRDTERQRQRHPQQQPVDLLLAASRLLAQRSGDPSSPERADLLKSEVGACLLHHWSDASVCDTRLRGVLRTFAPKPPDEVEISDDLDHTGSEVEENDAKDRLPRESDSDIDGEGAVTTLEPAKPSEASVQDLAVDPTVDWDAPKAEVEEWQTAPQPWQLAGAKACAEGGAVADARSEAGSVAGAKALAQAHGEAEAEAGAEAAHLAPEVSVLRKRGCPKGSSTPVGAARAAEQQRQRPQKQPVDLRVPVNGPSGFDVLSGRGQGVQRHPGNVTYRRLVFLHKGLYAGCPSADKAKISKGIVAAVRELGGGFLELDERTGTYRDIGDKRAWEKTSKTLREGQKMMWQKLHGNTASNDFDTSLLRWCHSRAGAVPTAEAYFAYSIQVLESLCKSHEGVPFQAPPSRRPQNPPPVRSPENAVGTTGNASDVAEGSADLPNHRREPTSSASDSAVANGPDAREIEYDSNEEEELGALIYRSSRVARRVAEGGAGGR